MSNVVYEIVTKEILAALERGVIPWEKPFIGHQNAVSRREYRGINVLLLACTSAPTPYWLTFKQAHDLGGHVKAGERSKIVTFWKLHSAKDENSGETKSFPLLRYYRIFNLAQTEGVKVFLPARLEAPDPIAECERVLTNTPCKSHLSSFPGQAFYQPDTDTLNCPERPHFRSAVEYYATMFHELVHATGHPSRLNRPRPGRFGSESYAREELIAEIGAAFLCAKCSIPPKQIENRAAYIQTWLKALQDDKRLVVCAAGAAQKAAAFVLNEVPQTEPAEVAA